MEGSIERAMSEISSQGEEPDRIDVSVLVPVLNEERHIEDTVRAMLAQRYDGAIEFLFADGRSDDRTRPILEQLARQDPRIRVLDNPRRQTPSGLNVCLRAARGEYVARMDAHTFYSSGYVAHGVERLRRGDVGWVAGPPLLRPDGLVSQAVALALSSRLGQGPTRRFASRAEVDLDTGVFGGVWRRDSVLAVGGWDERWPRNQDSEMAARFLASHERIVCLPEMGAEYVPRRTLRTLARQFFNYGYFRAATASRHPDSLRRSHVLLPMLALDLGAAVIGPPWLRRLARLGVTVYVGAIGLEATSVAVRSSDRSAAAVMPVVLPTMHVSWGVGFLRRAAVDPPLAALARVAGASNLARALDRRRGEPVYAPSLASEQ
jgi:succinoglycan biosynthesis protein ExoA